MFLHTSPFSRRLRLCRTVFLGFLALPLAACNKPYHPSAWLTLVPAAAHAQIDPLPPSAENMSEAADNYKLFCTACHAPDGAGRPGRPSLRNARVRGESDGDIHWILEHGSKNHGMPAWRSLGETDLWQLVQYIRAMPPQNK